eukprot:bmy_16084T0
MEMLVSKQGSSRKECGAVKEAVGSNEGLQLKYDTTNDDVERDGQSCRLRQQKRRENNWRIEEQKWNGIPIGTPVEVKFASTGWKGIDSVPKLAADYKNKKFDLDALVSHTLAFDKVNDAFDLMYQGKRFILGEQTSGFQLGSEWMSRKQVVRTAEWEWQRKTSLPKPFLNFAYPEEASLMEKQSKLPVRSPSHLISQGNLRKNLKDRNWMILSMKKKKTRRKRDIKSHPQNQLLDHSLQKNQKEPILQGAFNAQYLDDTELGYEEHPPDAVDEIQLLINGRMSIFEANESGFERLFPNQTDMLQHVLGVNGKILGPINEWWITGFDRGEKALMSFSTSFVKYIMMDPKAENALMFSMMQEKIYTSKVVVEFLQNNPDSAYEDRINKIEVTVSPLQFTAQFVVEQVENYDETGDSDKQPIFLTHYMRDLIKLAGVILGKRQAERCQTIGHSAKKRTKAPLKPPLPSCSTRSLTLSSQSKLKRMTKTRRMLLNADCVAFARFVNSLNADSVKPVRIRLNLVVGNGANRLAKRGVPIWSRRRQMTTMSMAISQRCHHSKNMQQGKRKYKNLIYWVGEAIRTAGKKSYYKKVYIASETLEVGNCVSFIPDNSSKPLSWHCGRTVAKAELAYPLVLCWDTQRPRGHIRSPGAVPGRQM